MKAVFKHVNLISEDWKKLARFYTDVFGCEPLPPERDLKGEWLDGATSINGAEIRGIHLILPGTDSKITLEIFQYNKNIPNGSKVTNLSGFTHIAFSVDDVEQCVDTILKHGGSLAGDIVKTEIEGVGKINFAYARDPEGNIIEIQKWD